MRTVCYVASHAGRRRPSLETGDRMPTARSRRLTRPAAAILLAALALGAVATTRPAHASVKFFKTGVARKTNRLYDHDCFWGGPRGMDYALLPDPQPIQIPNLYPDVGSTYFVAQFYLPDGATLTIHGDAPHERYFSFTIASNLPGGGLGNGDFLRDERIVPDPGSVNPAQPDEPRNAKRRAYTLQVVAGSPPEPRPDNTVYTGITDPNELVHLSMRNYIADRGKDGTGGVGLPAVTLHLADGSTLSGDALCAALRTTKAQTANATFPVPLWDALVAATPDPANAPSTNPVHWERFWNSLYSIAGLFIPDQTLRAATYPPTEAGGLAANPDTRYLFAGTSLNFGEVLVITGKKPTTPATYRKARTWPTTPWQVRYWSMCTASAPTSGIGYDCAWDEAVPVDANGYYHIVISRPEHRPWNAKTRCGNYWMDFGQGESYPSAAARPNVGVVYMRFMAANPDWQQAPQKVTVPNTEEAVMGEYFPHSEYMSQADFEATGCTR
jgi:hypothetical protein